MDGDLADARKLRARLLDEDVLAILVLVDARILLMRMSVDDDVDAARMRSHGAARPNGNGARRAQMGDEHDVLGSLRARFIDRLLNPLIELRAVLIFEEAVDELAILILKLLRRRRDNRFRCRHADQRDSFAVERDNLMCLEYRLIRPLVDEIAAIVAALELRCKLQEAIHAKIVLVVAGDGEIVVGTVHDADDRRAARETAERLSLHRIARIDEDDLWILLLQVVLVLRDSSDMDVLCDTAMHVVRVQNDSIRVCDQRQRGNPSRREKTADEFLHLVPHKDLLF